jgi:hypothetical protein
MILSSNHVNRLTHAVGALEPEIWQLMKSFWRFSCFYGEYQSLPHAKRRQFLESLESHHH